MNPTVYVETTIISYLAAWPSRDLITAANQQLTHAWWRIRRPDFELFTSQWVIDEAMTGDADAVARRQEYLHDLPVLDVTPAAQILARRLLERAALPMRAAPDALHVALAVSHGMDYLLTWNCSHLANAELRPRIEAVCRELGYKAVVLCTPVELMGEGQ